MKKRYILLITALALSAVLCICLLSFGSVCIGRIENHTDGQWSHIHMYLNGELTVDFPVTGENKPIVFQYETGRGSFSVEITDTNGSILYSNTSSETGSASFLASSDLKVRIKGEGHGGVFSLTRREDLEQLPDPEAPKFRFLDDGIHTGGTFIETFDCWRFDGKYMNFYVENNANTPVTISINDDVTGTIPAGKVGYITSTISATVLPQNMTVKCTSEDGSDLDIYWKAAQRSSNNG